jgi:hypothetical protein
MVHKSKDEEEVRRISRPSPFKEKEPSASQTIAKVLGGNLGTAPEILAKMKIDERKFGVLNDDTLTALAYFDYRGKVDDVRFWSHLVDWELTGSQGINGLGGRRILQALAASSPGGGKVGTTAQRPGMFARNLWKRSWKDQAYERGQDVSEDE